MNKKNQKTNATVNQLSVHDIVTGFHQLTGENELFELTGKPVTESVVNATKIDATMQSLVDVTKLVQTECVGTKCKVFTDSKNYVGFGVKCNSFSVNVKKTKYNVYCNDTVFDALVTGKYTDTEFLRDANTSDKTRPNLIECKNTVSLVAMIQTVLNTLYRVSTDTN